jgi:fatty aldehyde-generating acyl-ACP reductase
MSLPKVAFIGHPTSLEQFQSYMRVLKPEKKYRDQLALKLFEWTSSYIVKEFANLGLPSGPSVDGTMIMVPFLPEMREIHLRKITEKIEQAIDLGAKQGCTVAALGGFTSIILQGQEHQYAEKHRIKLTSGNSLTAATIVQSICEITEQFGIDLSKSTIAVVGASGDIGSGCVGYFCDRVAHLRLSAPGMEKLKQVAEKYRKFTESSIELFSDNREAVTGAGIIIFVTSAYQELFNLSDFEPGTIVCDASAPCNVKLNCPPRQDMFAYHGGVLSIPFEIDAGIDLDLPSTNLFYACQVEGFLIAMNPSLPCSWGRGNISREKLEIFRQLIAPGSPIRPVFVQGKKRFTAEELKGYEKAVIGNQ